MLAVLCLLFVDLNHEYSKVRTLSFREVGPGFVSTEDILYLLLLKRDRLSDLQCRQTRKRSTTAAMLKAHGAELQGAPPKPLTFCSMPYT